MWKKTELFDYSGVDYFKENTQLVSEMHGVDQESYLSRWHLATELCACQA